MKVDRPCLQEMEVVWPPVLIPLRWHLQCTQASRSSLNCNIWYLYREKMDRLFVSQNPKVRYSKSGCWYSKYLCHKILIQNGILLGCRKEEPGIDRSLDYMWALVLAHLSIMGLHLLLGVFCFYFAHSSSERLLKDCSKQDDLLAPMSVWELEEYLPRPQCTKECETYCVRSFRVKFCAITCIYDSLEWMRNKTIHPDNQLNHRLDNVAGTQLLLGSSQNHKRMNTRGHQD
jgi:hypothetical protein